MSELYSAAYHDTNGRWAEASAAVVVPLVVELLHPTSVVDVGCGVGAWLKEFEARGVDNVLGLEGETVPDDAVLLDDDQMLRCDFREPLPVQSRFDLVVSLEVAEHLPASSAAGFVKSLVALGDVVLFSAAIPGQAPGHHLNEQWQDYWARLFKSHDYVAVDCLRARLWDDPRVKYYYAQNALLYVRRDALELMPRLRIEAMHSTNVPLSLVHPRKFADVADVTTWSIRRVWGTLRFLMSYHFKSWVKRVTGIERRRARRAAGATAPTPSTMPQPRRAA